MANGNMFNYLLRENAIFSSRQFCKHFQFLFLSHTWKTHRKSKSRGGCVPFGSRENKMKGKEKKRNKRKRRQAERGVKVAAGP